MAVVIKRAYAEPEASDGFRVLVDRLWPRGVSRDGAELGLWLREVAPTPALRSWWNHDPERLAEFTMRYRAELRAEPDAVAAVEQLQQLIHTHGMVTLVYGARDPAVNHAAVLRDYLAELR